jgi:hypothetical protein
LITQFFTKESSRKYAKLGNSTAKSLIAVGAVIFFLFYVCSVGSNSFESNLLESSDGQSCTKDSYLDRDKNSP